nr:gag pol polyprotein [Hymenolepis microstoma]
MADRIHNHHGRPDVNAGKTSSSTVTTSQQLDVVIRKTGTVHTRLPISTQQTAFYFVNEATNPQKTQDVTSIQVVFSKEVLNFFVLNVPLPPPILSRIFELSFPRFFTVFARARRLHPDKLIAAKKESQHMVSLGIVRPSSGTLASHLHKVAKKKDYNPEEHKQHLQQVFEHEIAVNMENCILGQAAIDFLGHDINASGIAPMPEKTQSITAHSVPYSVISLRLFIGIVHYYGRCILNCDQILQSLIYLLKDNPMHFTMTSEAESAFSEVKQRVFKATALNHLDVFLGTPIILKTHPKWQ